LNVRRRVEDALDAHSPKTQAHLRSSLYVIIALCAAEIRCTDRVDQPGGVDQPWTNLRPWPL